MSSAVASTDLIDFLGVDAPPLSAPPDATDVRPADNLIDTGLPEFERKLQRQSGRAVPNNGTGRRPVDVEDVLIRIDSDEFERDSLDGDQDFLDLCQGLDNGNGDETTLPVDNFEALLVLKNLDDILNATLEEGADRDGEVNGNDDLEEEEDAQQVIEDCLEDLDNYLQGFDGSDSDGSRENEEDCSMEEERADESSEMKEDQPEFDEELERNKLRQIEENYRKFVAVSGIVNRAYVETENNADVTHARRPSSACDAVDRKRPFRAHTVSDGTRPKRSCSIRRRRSLTDDPAHRRTSGTPGPTAVVVVSCSSTATATTTVVPERGWLRSSMRRLEQVTLPNVESVGVGVDGETVAPEEARPVSAPSRLPPLVPPIPDRSRSRALGNGRPRSRSSSSRRPTSASSSDASSMDSGVERAQAAPPPVRRRSCDHLGHQQRTSDVPPADSPLGKWPHSLSSMMACLGCTLGLFNISRFAIQTVHFGANFIFQFAILSLVFGLPLFTLQLCLGQQLGAGVIDMWRISPLFQGVGVALLVTQALIGLYSIVGVSWMFVYFRDSFITALDKYRWAEPFLYYRKEVQPPVNGTYKLAETVPDYFNGVVLQRYHLPSGTAYGTIKFQSAFNLAVVWMIVFVSLSKGLRSYGKVIYAFTLLPVFGTLVLCAKILGLMPPEFVNIIFPETSWGEFFLNSRSWLAAAQETFLTWGLLGAALMQIASHNKHKHLLQRDSSLVAVITFSVLLLVAFLANTCVQILKSNGYVYHPSSFERMTTYQFMRHVKDPPAQSASYNTPIRYMRHNSFILGERIMRPGSDPVHESGYQVLRLATELLPATFALLGAEQVSPFWAVLAYFVLIMFGIAQQLAIWHCVITGIMAIKVDVLKKWESTITFFSCACGFILGLPMATELGIYVVYMMDYTMGAIWWLAIVVVMQIMAVFLVRGRPYSGDTVVTALFNQNSHSCLISWAPPLLSFTWNVILPVVLMVVCISTFKNGSFRDMFIWHHATFSDYWPLWARQIGSMLQLMPVLCIPLVAVIQSYRYLNNGPSDILDEPEDPSIHRIQLLYRPPIGEHMEDPPIITTTSTTATSNSAQLAAEDPPPKYTPPPSYTTATGARLAKFLRQSIRRSVRRLTHALGDSSAPSTSHLEQPPPDYHTVFVEMAAQSGPGTRASTLERLRGLQASPNALTAAEVASILRSSFRRSRTRLSPTDNGGGGGGGGGEEGFEGPTSVSAEHLMEAVAPMGETSLVLEVEPQEKPNGD